MKPTHQLRSGSNQDVVAWQFTPDAPTPAWVARNFHVLGNGDCLTHNSGHRVNYTDWIVRDPERAAAMVLTNEEFQLCFAALP
jgi:hypothetical protein